MDKILISVPIRQKQEILEKYLKSLDNLKIPENVEIGSYFILHNCYNEIKGLFHTDNVLEEFNDDSEEIRNGGITHDWKESNFSAVVNMKNKIVKYALKNNYDYIFMVDSDLILHPETLNRLYYILKNTDENVIGNIFYTDWDKSGIGLPNAWDVDQYGFLEDPVTRYNKKDVDLYQVGGTGACILIKTEIFKNPSINYNFIPNISFSYWEDRAFCIRCSINGIKILLDTKYPCQHLYHD